MQVTLFAGGGNNDGVAKVCKTGWTDMHTLYMHDI